MRIIGDPWISTEQAFSNWMDKLPPEDMQAWLQDVQELADLVGLEFGNSDPEDPRLEAVEQLTRALWTLWRMGYPLPILESLREGKGPPGEPDEQA